MSRKATKQYFLMFRFSKTFVNKKFVFNKKSINLFDSGMLMPKAELVFQYSEAVCTKQLIASLLVGKIKRFP